MQRFSIMFLDDITSYKASSIDYSTGWIEWKDIAWAIKQYLFPLRRLSGGGCAIRSSAGKGSPYIERIKQTA